MALSIIYVWIFQFYFSSSTSTLNCRHIQVSLNTAIFTGMPQISHNLKYVQNLFLPPFSSSLLSPSFSVQNPYSSWILSCSCAPWLIHLQVFFFFFNLQVLMAPAPCLLSHANVILRTLPSSLSCAKTAASSLDSPFPLLLCYSLITIVRVVFLKYKYNHITFQAKRPQQPCSSCYCYITNYPQT